MGRGCGFAKSVDAPPQPQACGTEERALGVARRWLWQCLGCRSVPRDRSQASENIGCHDVIESAQSIACNWPVSYDGSGLLGEVSRKVPTAQSLAGQIA